MGTADGSDPGRHRPMSATHDSVFKTSNPSSRHTPLGVPTPRGGSRFTASEPASAFAAASHGGIVLPRSVSARTENASSPAGSPAERDLSRPPASPAALPRQSALELGAAPRWSRPASPCRVNDTDSVDGPKHLQLPSHFLSPTSGARSALVAPRSITTGALEFPSGGRSFCSDLLSTDPGCIHGFGPDFAPMELRRCPLPSSEAPHAWDWRGPWVRDARGADVRFRRSSTFSLRPLAPLPDTFVTVP
jgi:hypothetical protein